jgi:prepilin-type N-terminal cleavage/methylation domain-containing protein
MTTSTTGPRTDEGREPRCGQVEEAGFTLLELILVMVVICTVLAVAAPSLRGFFASRQTADEASRIVALAQFARSQAVTEGRVYRLNFDLERGFYWLTTQRGGTFVALDNELGRRFPLPAGMRAGWLDEERDHIAFYADGGTDAATLQLVGLQGEVLEVTCSSPAEGYRVVDPTEAGNG